MIFRCRCCKQEKEHIHFVKDKYAPHGYKYLCLLCNAEKGRERRKEKGNQELETQKMREWRAKNRKYFSDYSKFLRGTNPDFRYKGREYGISAEEARLRMKQIKKEYDIRNKDKISAYCKSRKKENRKRSRDFRRRKKEQGDMQHKMLNSLRSRLGGVVQKLKTKKYEDTRSLLGCSMKFFTKWIERNFEQGMTWKNHGYGDDKWNLDHNLPCSSFDLTTKKGQKSCFHWTNIFLMWQKHNFAKKDNIWAITYEI